MRKEIVISDTSPIRVLNHLQLKTVLPALFETILLPPAVLKELEKAGAIGSSLSEGSWICRAPSNADAVSRLKHLLHDGEAEAIALAEELGARLLIDERAGRRVARSLGIEVTGVAGILILAKQQGHISNVSELLTQAREHAGFYVSDELLAKIRRIIGE